METNLITELSRVRQLMGLRNEDFKTSIIESVYGKRLLVEGELMAIEKLLVAGVKSVDELEKLFKALEETTGVKMDFSTIEKDFPELKNASKSEKLKKYAEILANKIDDIQAKLDNLEYNKAKLLDDVPELKPLDNYSKNTKVKGIGFDAALANRVKDSLLPTFKNKEPWKSILDRVYTKFNSWLDVETSARTYDLTEEAIHRKFTELLETEIKNDPSLKDAGKDAPSRVPDYVKYAWEDYINDKFPKMKEKWPDGLVGKLPEGKTPSDYAPKEAGGKNTQVLPGETPGKLDTFMIKHFPTIRFLFDNILDFFVRMVKEIGPVEARIKKNMQIIENLDIQKIITESEGGVPKNLQDIFTQLVADLEISSKKRGEFIQNYNKFVEKLKNSPGWDDATITKIEQETTQSANWGKWFQAQENLEQYLGRYEKRFLNPDGTKKTWFQNWKETFKEGSALTKEFEEGATKGGEQNIQKTRLGKIFSRILDGLKNIRLSRYFSLLTYKSFFTPRQIGFMIRQGGAGFIPIFTSFIAADLILATWNKVFRSFWALGGFMVKAFSGVGGGNEPGESAGRQFFQDLVGIWAAGLLSEDERGRQDIENWGLKWVYPLDFDSLIPNKLRELLAYATSVNKADEWIYKTYNERRAELWGKLKDKDKEEVLQKISGSYTEAFGKFSQTYQKKDSIKEDYILMLKQNGLISKLEPLEKKFNENKIKKEDYDKQKNDIMSAANLIIKKIYQSRIGNVELDIDTQPDDIKNTIESFYNTTISQEDADKKVESALAAIKNSIKVGAFMDKNKFIYTISTPTFSTLDYNFTFQQINFRPKYEVFYNQRDKYFQVYFSEKPDAKPIPQAKKDLENIEINFDDLGVLESGHIPEGKNKLITEFEIKKKLNIKNSEFPAKDPLTLTLIDFYNKL